MSDRSLKQYADILRNDFAAFTHRAFLELHGLKAFKFNWHIELLAEKLEAVRLGRSKRLILNLPPRHLKSFVGSIAFPAFVLGHKPETEILCISYGQDLADDLARSCRTLMESSFYQALFSTRLAGTAQAVDDFKTTAGGGRRARSLSGGITGGGADLIIIDDPIKADDAQSDARRASANEAFYSTIYSRLNDKEKDAIVLIMQRLHADDFTGHVKDREHWDVVALPAIAECDETIEIPTPYGVQIVHRAADEPLHPERESLVQLKTMRTNMSDYLFAAQYQQNPQPAAGAIVKRNWLRYYRPVDLPREFDSVIQSWDTATKPAELNSFNVCTTWGIKDQNFYLLDVFRGRLLFPGLRQKAMELYRAWHPIVVLVEEQSSGSPLLHELEQEGVSIQPVAVEGGDKAMRLYARINKFAAGYVHLPEQASWLEDFVTELTSFPSSKFSDQVDSTVQALSWDISSGARSFNNAMQAMKLLGGDKSPSNGGADLVEIMCLDKCGTIQTNDGRLIGVPPDGILRVDRELGSSLCVNTLKFRWIGPV